MKKTLSIILTAASLVLILDTLNAGQAVGMFFLVGAIPGTNINISASGMLILCALFGGFTVSRIATSSIWFIRRHKENPA